jgi:Galactose binding lectin domain
MRKSVLICFSSCLLNVGPGCGESSTPTKPKSSHQRNSEKGSKDSKDAGEMREGGSDEVDAAIEVSADAGSKTEPEPKSEIKPDKKPEPKPEPEPEKPVRIEVKGKTVCTSVEEWDAVRITCGEGEIVRAVQFASYGTPSGTCGDLRKGQCDAPEAMAEITEACMGRASCVVSATNTSFGDPCVGTNKRLQVQVECGPGTDPNARGTDSLVQCATAKEWNAALLACEAGQVISEVEFASYGTPSGMCGAFAAGECAAEFKIEKIFEECLGRNACVIVADSNHFGDPCPGKDKQLLAQVRCKPEAR